MKTDAPGYDIKSRSTPSPKGVPTNTGTHFMVGKTERGRHDEAFYSRTFAEWIDEFGFRTNASALLYDSVETHFREGRGPLWTAREVGDTPVRSSHVFKDADDVDTMKVWAKTVGEWGDDVDVEIIVPLVAGFRLEVSYLDAVVERSPDLVNVAAAVAWSLASSDYVEAEDDETSDDNPDTVAAQALAGGTDDGGAADIDNIQAAIDSFDEDKGPGQVSVPGQTTSAIHAALGVHCQSVEPTRIALCDAEDTDDDIDLETAAADARTAAIAAGDGETPRFMCMNAPWVEIPGVIAHTTRTVPPSAFVGGLMARSDAAGNSCNVPAAGDNGVAEFAIGLSQPRWSEEVRGDLNLAGVNVIRERPDGIKLFGYRTLVDPAELPDWVQLSNARFDMQLKTLFGPLAEALVLKRLDGRRHEIVKTGNQIVGVLKSFWDEGDIFGETPEEAFLVDAGESINPDSELAEGRVKFIVEVKMSPFAERVTIEIYKTRITEAL